MNQEAYQLEEVRLVQFKAYQSAANDDTLVTGIVPENRIWTITALAYSPSVAETRLISIEKRGRDGVYYAVQNPVQLALNPAVFGMDYGISIHLFPNELLRIRRSDHTLGSVMNLNIQIIESDLPLYSYVEPQAALREKKLGTFLKERMAAVSFGGRASGGTSGPVSKGPRPARPK